MTILGDRPFNIYMFAADQANAAGFPYLGHVYGSLGIAATISTSVLLWCYFCQDGFLFHHANRQNGNHQGIEIAPQIQVGIGPATGNAAAGTDI